MSTESATSGEKYLAALSVINEVLPRREMLGPLFDGEIDRLSAKCSQIFSEFQASMHQRTGRSHSDAALRRFEGLKRLEATLDGDAAQIAELQRLRSEKYSLLSNALTGNSLERVCKEVADPALQQLNEIEADLFKWQREYFELGILIGDLRHHAFEAQNQMWMVESSRNLRLRKQIIELHAVLHTIKEAIIPRRTLASIMAGKFTVKSADDGLQGVLKGFEGLSELLPLAAIVLESAKEWREDKFRLQEAVDRVSALIAIRMVIALWEEEIKPLFAAGSDETHFVGIDEWESKVSDLHQRWIARGTVLKAGLAS